MKKSLKEQVLEAENKWKRALADYENLVKRTQREKENFFKFANRRLLEKLLGVLDDLELCRKHLDDQGLNLGVEKFKELLESEGVKEIEVLGKNFDPQLMEAVEMTAGPKNKVVEVVAKGYLLNETILRPAKVKVGGPPAGGVDKKL